MKKIIRKFFPWFIRRPISRIVQRLRFYREWFLDGQLFLHASTTLGFRSEHFSSHLESEIIRGYHAIEKSLSMPEYRPRSAQRNCRNLLKNIKAWSGPETASNRAALSVLKVYCQRHADLGINIDDIISEEDLRWINKKDAKDFGGTKPYAPANKDDRDGFFRIVESRVSVRNFKQNIIPNKELIQRAIQAAMKSPSVCNRQTCLVYVVEGSRVQEALALQNGNAGFGHVIPQLLVVASDLRQFTGVTERYQAWTEGGLFSMSLLLALHAQGLGAVPLNWEVLNKVDRKLKRILSIPKYNRIIMLIGCGVPADEAVVPISCRRDFHEILQWRDSQN